jgi:hypothetical protein
MFDPQLEANERGRRLRFEAHSARLVRPPTPRRALADALRRAADHLDPVIAAPLRPRPR